MFSMMKRSPLMFFSCIIMGLSQWCWSFRRRIAGSGGSGLQKPFEEMDQICGEEQIQGVRSKTFPENLVSVERHPVGNGNH
uniref:Uncharacterized protein n=1 Tax=Anguilla anguilla TaxID=7936 RepID=A0A0E9SFT3_ANGAN